MAQPNDQPEHTNEPQENPEVQPDQQNRKAYRKPAIIHELELETRAGSPVSHPFDDFYN